MNGGFTICGTVLCLSHIAALAQDEKAVTKRSLEITQDRKTILEMYNIPKLTGVDRTPANEPHLKQLLRDYGDFLFRGEGTKDKFYALSGFCELIKRSPDGKKIVPELIAVVFELEAPTSKVSEIKDWEKSTIRAGGDRIGLLMSCILEVSGKEKFEEMFNHFEKQGQLAKITILLERLAVRKDRQEYLDLLSEKLKGHQDIKIKEVIQSAISRIRGEQSQ